jgi:hypothetical protein
MFARPGFDLYPNDLDSIHREHQVESANVVFDYLGSRRRLATQPNPLLAEQCDEWSRIAIRGGSERLSEEVFNWRAPFAGAERQHA